MIRNFRRAVFVRYAERPFARSFLSLFLPCAFVAATRDRPLGRRSTRFALDDQRLFGNARATAVDAYHLGRERWLAVTADLSWRTACLATQLDRE